MLRDAFLILSAFACLGAGSLLFVLGTAPTDHPAGGWLARVARVERTRVPRLVLVMGGGMLLVGLIVGILLARSISVVD